MLTDNLCIYSFAEAVEKTFNGKNPCNLCEQIAAEKESEKKTEFPFALKKLEFVSDRIAFVFSAPQEFRLVPVPRFSAREIAHKPPSPPPRGLLV